MSGIYTNSCFGEQVKMDYMDEYIGEILDNVREKFDSQLDGRVIPEMVDFMRNEPSAKKMIEVVREITVALTMKELMENPAKFLSMISIPKNTKSDLV